MKSYTKRAIFLIFIATICFPHGTLFGQRILRSSGIILRGTFWNVTNEQAMVSVSRDGEVSVGQAGGWLCFFSRISERSFIELGLGAIGNVHIHSQWHSEEDVEVSGMTPVFIGFRYHLLRASSYSTIQPYLSAGGGPYWQSDVLVNSRYDDCDEDVAIHTKLYPGIYAGGGFNLLLGSWFGVNFDMRYHLINMEPANSNSGFEFGFGLVFSWGQYKAR